MEDQKNIYDKEHELIRMKLWSDIACSYVNSSNSTRVNGAAEWADKVLKDFDSRFNKNSLN